MAAKIKIRSLAVSFILACSIVALAFLWYQKYFDSDCYGTDRFEFQVIGEIEDKRINESSGLAFEKDDQFWTQNDDTDTNLYLISAKGNTIFEWPIPFQNRDWEEICKDDSGNVYIGDFGNNLQLEQNLRILKLNVKEKRVVGEISFSYQDKKNEMVHYDCEAMVHWRDSLYLFTKSKSERKSRIFVLPDLPGEYKIGQKQKLELHGLVTGAALRPDGKELALLTYGKIYFYSIPSFISGKIPSHDFCFASKKMKQSESISYWGSDSLLVGNEEGDLFLMKRKL